MSGDSLMHIADVLVSLVNCPLHQPAIPETLYYVGIRELVLMLKAYSQRSLWFYKLYR